MSTPTKNARSIMWALWNTPGGPELGNFQDKRWKNTLPLQMHGESWRNNVSALAREGYVHAETKGTTARQFIVSVRLTEAGQSWCQSMYGGKHSPKRAEHDANLLALALPYEERQRKQDSRRKVPGTLAGSDAPFNPAYVKQADMPVLPEAEFVPASTQARVVALLMEAIELVAADENAALVSENRVLKERLAAVEVALRLPTP